MKILLITVLTIITTFISQESIAAYKWGTLNGDTVCMRYGGGKPNTLGPDECCKPPGIHGPTQATCPGIRENNDVKPLPKQKIINNAKGSLKLP